ncbi:unnamed protein product, partial [Prorocentrum cordatum]
LPESGVVRHVHMAHDLFRVLLARCQDLQAGGHLHLHRCVDALLRRLGLRPLPGDGQPGEQVRPDSVAVRQLLLRGHARPHGALRLHGPALHVLLRVLPQQPDRADAPRARARARPPRGGQRVRSCRARWLTCSRGRLASLG